MAFRLTSKQGRPLGQYETFHEAVKEAITDNTQSEREIQIEDTDPAMEAIQDGKGCAKILATGSILIKKAYLELALRLEQIH